MRARVSGFGAHLLELIVSKLMASRDLHAAVACKPSVAIHDEGDVLRYRPDPDSAACKPLEPVQARWLAVMATVRALLRSRRHGK